MDRLLRDAFQQQRSSPALLEALRLQPPLSSTLLQSDLVQQGRIPANTDAQYHRLLRGYIDYAKLWSTNNVAPSPSMEQQLNACLEIAAGFNYAFDQPWMVPLAKLIYTHTSQLALHVDRQWEQRSPSTTSTTTITRGAPHPERVKAVCVLLDVLRAKMMDRNSFPTTRKAGILFTLNLIFLCYLQLNNMKQMQKVLDYVFHHVLQPQSEQLIRQWFPRSERTTYHFFMGKFLLMQHNVPEALIQLEKANQLCPLRFAKNKRCISLYWMVAQLVSGRFAPKNAPIWRQFPDLQALFGPLLTSIRLGHIGQWKWCLEQQRSFWSRCGLYDLLRVRLERAVYRNLARRVFLIGSGIVRSTTFGYFQVQDDGDVMMQEDGNANAATTSSSKSPPRISLDDLCTGWRVAGDPFLSNPDVSDTQQKFSTYFGWSPPPTMQQENQPSPLQSTPESLLSCMALVGTLLDAGFLRGYLSTTNRCVVVSRKQAFPNLQSVLARVMEREQWWQPVQVDRQIVEEDD